MMQLRSAMVLGTAPFHKGRSELFKFTLIPHTSSRELYGYSTLTYDPFLGAISVDGWLKNVVFTGSTGNNEGN